MIAGLLFACLAVFFIGFSDSVSAQDLGIDYAADLGLADADPRLAAVELVRLGITFLGIIAVVFVLYAGYLWMTSAGNDDKIVRAKKTLINAIIGLVVILAAFLIVSFVISRLNDSLGGGGGAGGGGGPSTLRGLSVNSSNLIETHYPVRNQMNVARNTKIVITFKEPMTAGDLILDGRINAANVKIHKSSEADGPFLIDFTAAMTPDLKTVVYTQEPPYIGSPSENIRYSVDLTNAIHKANGDLAWPELGGGYSWYFETGTFIDLTPPRITGIIPAPAASEPRNAVIQINFSEAIDPVAASGPSSLLSSISVSGDSVPITGNFYISNEYRTVEFLTEDACGVNSCGQTVYCLPGDSAISVLVKAATLAAAGESAAMVLSGNPPFDGLLDMANNSLDGNKNGEAEGPQTPASGGFGSGRPPYDENNPYPLAQGDDYIWSFATTDLIDTTPPKILSVNPQGTDVTVTAPVSAAFSKILMHSSLTRYLPPESGTVGLFTPLPGNRVDFSIWAANNADQTTVSLRHDPFAAGITYIPEFNSGIKDRYQNCYSPSGGPDFSGGDCVPNPPSEPFCCNGTAQAGSCSGF